MIAIRLTSLRMRAHVSRYTTNFRAQQTAVMMSKRQNQSLGALNPLLSQSMVLAWFLYVTFCDFFFFDFSFPPLVV